MVMIVLTACCLGIKAFSSSHDEYSFLLIENIEALTAADDGGYNSSECSDGFPRYANVYSGSSKREVVQHFSDGVNGESGIDMVYTEDCFICSAEGTGSLYGSNYIMPVGYSAVEYRKCTCSQGNRNMDF